MKIQFGGNHCKKHNFWLGLHDNKCLAGGAPLLPTECYRIKGWVWGLSAQASGSVVVGELNALLNVADLPRCGISWLLCTVATWWLEDTTPEEASQKQLSFCFSSERFCLMMRRWYNVLIVRCPRGTSLFPLASWIVWAWHNWGWKSFSQLCETSLLLQTNTVSPVSLCCRGWTLTAVLLISLLSHVSPRVPVLVLLCPGPLVAALTHRSSSTLLSCWQGGVLATWVFSFSPSGLKLSCYWVSQSEWNTLKVHTVLLLLLSLLLFSTRSLFCDHIPTWWIKSAGTIAPCRLFPPWFHF